MTFSGMCIFLTCIILHTSQFVSKLCNQYSKYKLIDNTTVMKIVQGMILNASTHWRVQSGGMYLDEVTSTK